MGELGKFLACKPRDISVEELEGEIAREESPNFCELEVLCYDLHGLEDVWVVDEGSIVGQTYVCGFRTCGTVQGCPRRRGMLDEL